MAVVISRPINKGVMRLATLITYDWAEDVVQSMICGGLEVYDLRKNVTRDNIEYYLQQENVDTFIHYGHGEDYGLLGSNGQTILDDENLCLLKNKIVISINCESADNFGAKTILCGAKCYMGFDKKVYIKYNNRRKPYVGFKESNNAWNTLRLDGNWHTMWEGFNTMANEYNKWINIYIQNGYPDIADCLQRSLNSMLILGDKTQYMPVQEPVELVKYNITIPRY